MENPSPRRIQNTYLLLTLFSTLAASFIFGINTLFLLDAGLTNTQAFAANAFFTAGQVIFEIPTGVIADSIGRRVSYLLGTLTLGISTALYLLAWHMQAPFLFWAITSALLGLGFTFFSGATEAWLVDALNYSQFKGALESVFARAQIVSGIAMLTGSVAGGFIAQSTNLGVPYILRAVMLGATFVLAFFLMRDWGFTPIRGKSPISDVKTIFQTSIDVGIRKPSIRWIMLAAPFTAGVGIYAFYATQPYLLELFGDETAYGIAGLAAAIVAGAQIAGGFMVPLIRRLFKRRTTIFIISVISSTILLALIGLTTSFWFAIVLLVIWGLLFAATTPVRQAYLNGLIPSSQRATVLSFDSLMGSSGGVVIQPILGRAADVSGYATSYVISAGIQAIAIPFMFLARRENAESDHIVHTPPDEVAGTNGDEPIS